MTQLLCFLFLLCLICVISSSYSYLKSSETAENDMKVDHHSDSTVYTAQNSRRTIEQSAQSIAASLLSKHTSTTPKVEKNDNGPKDPPCLALLSNHKTAPSICYNKNGILSISTPDSLLKSVAAKINRVSPEDWTIFKYDTAFLIKLMKILENSIKMISVDDKVEEMYDYILYGAGKHGQDMFKNQHSPELWIPYLIQHSNVSALTSLLYVQSKDSFSEGPLFNFVKSHVYMFHVYVLQENRFFTNPLFYWEKHMGTITRSEEWKLANGMDFIIPSTHPMTPLNINDKSVELNILAHSTFLVVDNDMKSRYPKDTIIPYYASHAINHQSGIKPEDILTTSRTVLIYFAGSPYQSVREKVLKAFESSALKSKDIIIHARTDNTTEFHNYMYKSTFCLVLRGDTTSSSRLFSAIAMGCIPIIVSDWILLPYEKIIDYTLFTIQVEESFILSKPQSFIEFVRNISSDKIDNMRKALSQARDALLYESIQDFNPVSLMLIDNLINRINFCVGILGNANIPLETYKGFKTSMCNRIHSRVQNVLKTDIFELYGVLEYTACMRGKNSKLGEEMSKKYCSQL